MLSISSTRLFALGLVLLPGITGCHSRSTLSLKTSVIVADTTDTIAYVTYTGSGGQETDTIYHFSEGFKLDPDTSRFQQVSVTTRGGATTAFYQLSGNKWEQSPAKTKTSPLPRKLPPFRAKDVLGKEQTFADLYRHHPLLLFFAPLEGDMRLNSSDLTSSLKACGDSLASVAVLYSCPSDSLARGYAKRDQLKAMLFADSLGQVSSLRQSLGISQQPQLLKLLVDSTGSIKRLK